MSSFTFPPPPPPPPPPSTTYGPPPVQSNRGGFTNNRGSRGRGRGNGHSRGGYNQRGGHQQFHNAPAAHSAPPQPPPMSNNYPPAQMQWNQPHVQSAPNYQAPPALPVSSYTPQYNHRPPQYQHYPNQAQQPHMLPQAGPPQNIPQLPTMNNPPPIRLGFDRPHQKSHSPDLKRKRDAIPRPKPDSKPKIPAAPVIPTFGFSLPPKPQSSLPSGSSHQNKNKRRRKQNVLGLTPMGDVNADSDDEVDEEAVWAASGGQSLSIQHRGRTIELKNAADVAAWRAERKKRYPTQARVAERKAEMARREEERQKREVQKRDHQQKHLKEKKGKKDKQHGKKKQNITAASSQHEAIPEDPIARIAYLEKQLEIAKQAALSATTPTVTEVDPNPTQLTAASDADTVATEVPKTLLGLAYSTEDEGDAVPLHKNASDISSPESSSESSASDSDSDAPPEESSSKAEGPVKVDPPLRSGPAPLAKEKHICRTWVNTGQCKFAGKCRNLHVCRNLARFGNCKFGEECKWSHDVVPSSLKKPQQNSSLTQSRKKIPTLRERWIEMEEKAEVERALDVIQRLGKEGFLDE